MSSTTYNAYTGTFTTKNGQTRTMTFVRGNDLPQTVFEGKQRPTQTGVGHEVVYDVNAHGFRTFNWNTAKGNVSQKMINYSFDNIKK